MTTNPHDRLFSAIRPTLVIVPLERAVLCQNCRQITNSPGERCIACDSPGALLNLATVLDKKEEKPSPSKAQFMIGIESIRRRLGWDLASGCNHASAHVEKQGSIVHLSCECGVNVFVNAEQFDALVTDKLKIWPEKI